MKYRDYKESGVGEYYHIFNRGNEKRNIFIDDDDYNFFIFRLKQNLFPDKKSNPRAVILPENSFSLVSYCLMPNHFHFLIRQTKDLNPGRLLLKLCTSYSMYFNKKYNRVGHVFQDQFKQVLVGDNDYLKWLSAYIHQNPKTANIVENLGDYRWSSYRSFINIDQDYLCDKNIILEQFKNVEEYKEFVEDSSTIIKSRKGLEEMLLD